MYLIQLHVRLALQHSAQARHAVQFFFRVHRFGDAVAEQNHGVIGLQLQRSGGEFRFRNKTNRERAFCERFFDGVLTDEDG